MTKEFMIARDGQQYGPYSTEDLLQYLKDGQVSLDDLVWSEGMEDWQPLREIRDQLVSSSSVKLDAIRKDGVESAGPMAGQIDISKTATRGRKYAIASLIGVAVLAVIGYSASSSGGDKASIVGVWSCTDAHGDFGFQTFQGNGTVEYVDQISMSNGNTETLRMLGRYDSDGSKIKMVCDSVSTQSLGTNRCTLSYSGNISVLDKNNLSYTVISNRNNTSSYKCARSK